jgi:hypothetical protein
MNSLRMPGLAAFDDTPKLVPQTGAAGQKANADAAFLRFMEAQGTQPLGGLMSNAAMQATGNAGYAAAVADAAGPLDALWAPRGTRSVALASVRRAAIGEGGFPGWKGAGPTPGTFGVGPMTESVAGLRNYYPRQGGIEFIFDPMSSTIVVGRARVQTGSPHESLAASVGANPNRVVGGMFWRVDGGSIQTNEFSGHFWQNWTPQIRQQFVDFMNSKGLPTTHKEGM